MFKKRISVEQVEEGRELCPRFDEKGLIPVITTDYKTGEILMHGFMNEEAFRKTIKTKEAHYFSRSRKTIWHKGKTSGWVQKIKFIRIDDDQDSVWISVDIGEGAQEWSLDDLINNSSKILKGEVSGRVIIDVNK